MDNATLLFVSRDSATFHYVKRQVEAACDLAFGPGHQRVRVIDVADHPDLAEKYNIEALPTVIIGNRRFIGVPTAESLAAFLGSLPPSRA